MDSKEADVKRIYFLCLVCLCVNVIACSAFAETCQYKTQWGVVTLITDGSNATGNYPHKNGKINGTMQYPDISGQWIQNDGTGNFHFVLYNGGFTGNWNYTGEKKWRGAWNGTLVRCY